MSARDVLTEIQARADKATAGPWAMWGMGVLTARDGYEYAGHKRIAQTYDPDRGLRTFNGDFICAARTDVPRLVKALTEVLKPHTEWLYELDEGETAEDLNDDPAPSTGSLCAHCSEFDAYDYDSDTKITIIGNAGPIVAYPCEVVSTITAALGGAS